MIYLWYTPTTMRIHFKPFYIPDCCHVVVLLCCHVVVTDVVGYTYLIYPDLPTVHTNDDTLYIFLYSWLLSCCCVVVLLCCYNLCCWMYIPDLPWYTYGTHWQWHTLHLSIFLNEYVLARMKIQETKHIHIQLFSRIKSRLTNWFFLNFPFLHSAWHKKPVFAEQIAE